MQYESRLRSHEPTLISVNSIRSVADVEERIEMILTASKEHKKNNEADPEFSSTPFSEAVVAAEYHVKSGGRRVRAQLALDAGKALELDPESAVVIATTVELLHNASLIHDDLQDRSRTRRGLPSVWLHFGDGIAVCAGDFLISAAYRSLVSFPEMSLVPALFESTHKKVAQSISGQCGDLAARRQYPKDVSIYEQIVAAKSGSLLSLPLELSLLAAGFSNFTPIARRAADAFAVGYQIVDDLEDLSADIGTDESPRSLNLVLVLQAAGLGEGAKDKARSIAMKHLKLAFTLAEDLPNEAGASLRSLALSLWKEF